MTLTLHRCKVDRSTRSDIVASGAEPGRTLPVEGSGTAPLTPMVKLGTGFVSDKLVMSWAQHTSMSALVKLRVQDA